VINNFKRKKIHIAIIIIFLGCWSPISSFGDNLKKAAYSFVSKNKIACSVFAVAGAAFVVWLLKKQFFQGNGESGRSRISSYRRNRSALRTRSNDNSRRMRGKVRKMGVYPGALNHFSDPKKGKEKQFESTLYDSELATWRKRVYPTICEKVEKEGGFSFLKTNDFVSSYKHGNDSYGDICVLGIRSLTRCGEITNFDVKGLLGDTFLHKACRLGRLEDVRFLTEDHEIGDNKNVRSTYINTRNMYKDTPLHVVCHGWLLKISKYMNSESIEEKNESLLSVCRSEYLEIARHLLAKGADRSERNIYGIMPLMEVLFVDNLMLIRHLLRAGANVNARDESEATPLHMVCQKGAFQEVVFLLKAGADLKARDKYGITPLHYACRNGNAEIIELLIENGADIEARTRGGSTPLNYACEDDKVDVVRLLLGKGADIHTIDNRGATLLHNACYHGSVRCAELFLERGLGVCTETNDDSTPLHDACKNGNVEIIGLLMENGADACLRTNDRSTPLLNLLDCRERNRKVLKEDEQIVEILVKNGVDVSAINAEGKIPLGLACKSKNKQIVKLIVEAGANINLEGRFPVFARLYETFSQPLTHLERSIAKYLIKHGINISHSSDRTIKYLFGRKIFQKCAEIKAVLSAISGKDIRNISRVEVNELIKLIKHEKTPAYEKQTAVLFLFNLYNCSIVSSEDIREYIEQLPFNYRFFNEEEFRKIVSYALEHNLKDVHGRSVLCASAAFSKDGNIPFQALLKSYGQMCYGEDVQKKENLTSDVRGAFTVLKERNRKLYTSLRNMDITWDDLQDNCLIDEKDECLEPAIVSEIVEFAGIGAFRSDKIYYS